MLKYWITKIKFNSHNNIVMEFRKRFAKRFKELRIMAGLSQEDIANAMGYSEKTVSYWENGHNPIKFDNLPELAKVLGVPEYKLLVFGELNSQNNEEILDLLNSMTEKERNIVSQVIKSILMLR